MYTKEHFSRTVISSAMVDAVLDTMPMIFDISKRCMANNIAV